MLNRIHKCMEDNKTLFRYKFASEDESISIKQDAQTGEIIVQILAQSEESRIECILQLDASKQNQNMKEFVRSWGGIVIATISLAIKLYPNTNFNEYVSFTFVLLIAFGVLWFIHSILKKIIK